MRPKIRALCLTAVVALAVGTLGAAPASAAPPGVDPASVDLTLAPGQSSTIATTVTTPAIGPNPDIVFLADTTGSMQPVLANVSQNIRRIVSEVKATQPTARFGVTEYKEQRNTRAFHVNSPMTTDENQVANGVNDWLINVGGGGAPWTDFINAHYQIGTEALAFRPNGTRIVVWFGDARSHDPSLGHTLQDAINALRAQGVRVVAVPLDGTAGGGLDALGQASAITAGTGGVLMPPTAANAVAQALLDGMRALEQTVTPTVTTCDPQLTVGFDPTTRSVRSGTEAQFTQTITAAASAAPGTYTCTVDIQLNGISVGYIQTITVDVSGSAAPSLSIGDVSVAEGNSGSTPATFTVTLNEPSNEPVTVQYATSDGTATSPSDFVATGGDLTFAPGDTSEVVTVPVAGDTAVEPDETFTVGLASPVGAGIADGSGVGTIVDDDGEVPPLALSIGDVSVTEGNSGSTPATFTVTLSEPSNEPVSVQWATVEGTATQDDFVTSGGEVTFAPGDTSEVVTVPVAGDTAVEPDETFTVGLSSPVGAGIADGSGVGTIVDDDGEVPPLALSIGDVSVTEGNSGSTPATFTVTLNEPSNEPVTVQYATSDGTATSPSDFVATGGDLTFAPGDTSEVVTVPVVGDTVPETDETFSVELSDPTGATVVDGAGVGTIVDDDDEEVPPALSVGDATAVEGSAATFTVSLDKASASPVTVHVATADGTAAAPDDFAATSLDLTFAPAETSKQVTVPTVGDTVDEPDETFTFQLSSPTGATIADGSGVGTILDNDAASLLAINDVTATEGSAATFTVNLDRPTSFPVTVHYATANGTGTAPGDYAAASGDLAFAPGETSKQVSVQTAGDTVDEPDETFTVVLSNPSGGTLGDATGVGTIVDDDRDGAFTCTATAVRSVVANQPNNPCADDTKSVAAVDVNLGLLRIRANGPRATTGESPDAAVSTAQLGTTRISTIGLTIELSGTTSTATARCVGSAPTFAGSSSVGTLKVNGLPVPIGNGPVTIPLVVGTLKLNSTTTTATGVTQRAVELQSLLGNVVLGEARAGVTGTPSHPSGNPCVG